MCRRKYKTDLFSQKELNKIFKLIDKMPMRKTDSKLNKPLNQLNICN